MTPTVALRQIEAKLRGVQCVDPACDALLGAVVEVARAGIAAPSDPHAIAAEKQDDIESDRETAERAVAELMDQVRRNGELQRQLAGIREAAAQVRASMAPYPSDGASVPSIPAVTRLLAAIDPVATAQQPKAKGGKGKWSAICEVCGGRLVAGVEQFEDSWICPSCNSTRLGIYDQRDPVATGAGEQREASLNLGDVLRKYRIFSERTLRDLAREIGCSPATLLRIEQLHHADSRTVGKIIAWLFKEPVVHPRSGHGR